MSSYLKILFLTLQSRANRNNEFPIYCKLTLDNSYLRFATGIFVSPKQWSQKKQIVIGKSVAVENANTKLQEIKAKILAIEAELIRRQEKYTLEDVVNKFSNKDTVPFKTLMEAYSYRHNQMLALEGIEYKSSSIRKNLQLQKVVKDYLIEELKQNDIVLSKVNIQFLNEFETYLRGKRSVSIIHSNKIIQKLKGIMQMALEFRVIDKPAFPNHKFKHQKLKVVFLTINELEKLEYAQFAQNRLNLIRDIFLFSVYTGLHYADAMSLTKDNLVQGVDDKDWIIYTRQKTGVKVHIPILDKAQQLITKFQNEYELESKIIPKFSNQKINSYLKEIADILGIDKPLSHKIARKTFGSLLLYYNTPMKVVSKLMGHNSVLITERHYADVELRKLGEEMERVGFELDEKKR